MSATSDRTPIRVATLARSVATPLPRIESGGEDDNQGRAAPSTAKSRPAPPVPLKGNHVPIEPIQDLIEQAISQTEAAGVDDPVWALAERLAAYRERHGLGEGTPHTFRRTLWRIRNGKDSNKGKTSVVTGLTFDMADLILCALGRVELWREDERLAAVYERVRLSRDPRRGRDMTTCPGCGGAMWCQSALCWRCERKRRSGSREAA